MSTIAAPATDAPSTSETLPTTTASRWPIYGALAGVIGTAATVLSVSVSPDAKARGVESVFEELGSNRLHVHIGASLGFISVALLVAFGIGLYRYLAARVPAASSIPLGILISLAGGAGAMLLTFSLKAMLAGGMPGGVDAALYTQTDVTVLHLLVDQLQWACWMGLAFMIALTAAASFKYRAISRWLGTVSVLFSAFFIFMTLGLGLPYSSGVIAGPWLLIAGLGLIKAARR